MSFPAWSLSGQTHEPAQKQHCLQSTIQNVHTVREGTNTRSPAEAPTRQPAQAGPRRYRQPLAPRQHVAPPNPQLPQAAPANAAQRGGTGRSEVGRGGDTARPRRAPGGPRRPGPAASGREKPARGRGLGLVPPCRPALPLHTGAGGEGTERLGAAAAAVAAAAARGPVAAPRGCASAAGVAGG